MTNQEPIPVVVNGAAGKMGREVIKAVSEAPDMNLLGAIDTSPEHQDKDAGELAGLSEPLEVPITNQMEAMLAFAAQEKQPYLLWLILHIQIPYMTTFVARSPMGCVLLLELLG